MRPDLPSGHQQTDRQTNVNRYPNNNSSPPNVVIKVQKNVRKQITIILYKDLIIQRLTLINFLKEGASHLKRQIMKSLYRIMVICVKTDMQTGRHTDKPVDNKKN